MAGRISGLYVAVTAVGAVLVWSGWKGATLAATFKSLTAGNLNAPSTEGAPVSSAAGAAGLSATGLSSSTANANYLTIARYLTSNGYSNAAAAGICACIAGESDGNPEARQQGGTGVGLIQWSGSNASDITLTGNATADLQQQLPAIIAYNNGRGENLVAMLNQISDPVQAADFYSQHFEAPAVTDSDVRAGVAQWVYAQLQSPTPATTRTPAEIIASAV